MSAAEDKGLPYAAVGEGVLRQHIETAALAAGVSLKSLTVLSTQVDPYRLDTPAGHAIARWCADAIAAVLPDDADIHLRGLHYRLISTTAIVKPDGTPYRNTDEDWVWLSSKAAKAARWLGYVPFERITDERNEPPTWADQISYRQPFTPRRAQVTTRGIDLPSVEDVLPSLEFYAGETNQPYRIALIGEKTSLKEVLRPIRRKVGGDLLLPSGEPTDTQLYELAKRAHADGRPLVVLYFSDFDPSGWQMPVSVARKLQAFRDLFFPGLVIAGVFPVALTVEQVRDLDLPSTPLKITELRASAWREKWGREQTEIDALAALRPDVLREIAEQAIKPFYDASLATRSARANAAWETEARSRLVSEPTFTIGSAQIEEAFRSVEIAADNLAVLQDRVTDELVTLLNGGDLGPAPDKPVAPILEIPPPALFSSTDDHATASRKLIDRKRLADEEGAP